MQAPQFKKYDLVYNKKTGAFGVIKEVSEYNSLYVDVYKHDGQGPVFQRRQFWFKRDAVVYAGPDNLKTRLAMKIKYGVENV